MRETLMKFISDAVLRTIGGGAEILPSLFAKCIIFAMKKMESLSVWLPKLCLYTDNN